MSPISILKYLILRYIMYYRTRFLISNIFALQSLCWKIIQSSSGENPLDNKIGPPKSKHKNATITAVIMEKFGWNIIGN